MDIFLQQIKDIDKTLITEFEFASGVISGIRNIRKQKNIAFCFLKNFLNNQMQTNFCLHCLS